MEQRRGRVGGGEHRTAGRRMMPLLHRDGDGGRWVVDRPELWDQGYSLVSFKPGGLPLTLPLSGRQDAHSVSKLALGPVHSRGLLGNT
jgi:hypothetical protein